MKKRGLFLALAGALVLGLCACGRPAGDPTGPVEPPASQGSTRAPEDPVGGGAGGGNTGADPSAGPTGEPSHPPIALPTDPGEEPPVDETVLQPAGPAEGSQDLHFFMDELFPTVSEYQFPPLKLMDDETLIHAYPGLGAIPVRQRLIYIPEMTGVACEFAFVEVENEADADAVNTIFQQRIETQVEGGAFYPAMIERWENNARIFQNGNYVFLAVHEMSEYMAGEGGDFETALGLG